MGISEELARQELVELRSKICEEAVKCSAEHLSEASPELYELRTLEQIAEQSVIVWNIQGLATKNGITFEQAAAAITIWHSIGKRANIK